MRRLGHPLSPELRFALTLLLVGAALRFALLGSNPPGMFRDEAEKVYTAWSLGQTGGYHHLVHTTDPRTGVPLPVFERLGPPLFVDAYGSWTSAIYHWCDVPFALALGPTPLAARLPAALAGLLTLLALWRYARRAFDAEVALLALFFLAISPWHVLFSRWAQQGIFVPLWLALALLMFERGRLAAGRPWWLAGVCLALALYTYEPMRVTVPLFVIALAWAHRGDLRRNRQAALLALLAFVATLLPVGLWMAAHRAEGLQRWTAVTIFSEETSLGEEAAQFVANWLSHLSFPFLFLGGDANSRHSIPGFGQMHLIELPGLLIGLVIALTQRRPQDLTLALWFLLAPIAPSLTREAPHALRGIAALPAAHLISAFGTAAIFRGAVRWAHESLPLRLRRLKRLHEWLRVNIDGLRATGLVLGGATALLLVLQLFLRAPALTAEVWETGLHDALRQADALAAGRRPVFVSGRVLYLPTHLRVARRTPPASLPEVTSFLPPGWNQTGQGEYGPAALWDQFGQAAVFITTPGEIPDREPVAVIRGPGNRFTAPPRVLWEIHAAPAPPEDGQR